MRRCGDQHIEFPFTLGRDFVGVVVNKGMSVRESLRVGDRVWGTVPFHRDGSHAEYITTDACLVSVPGLTLEISQKYIPLFNVLIAVHASAAERR